MIRSGKLPDNIHERIDLIAAGFLTEEQNIVFAYLFGGLARNRQTVLSDVDIAIYVRNMKKLDYLDLLGKISDTLGIDGVDLIILNTAPISLAGRVLQGRKVLVDKDPFLRHQYESLALREYFDFSIKERDLLRRRYGIG
jgi:uncharacterized protein